MKKIKLISLSQAEKIWKVFIKKEEYIMPFFSFEWYKSWVEVNRDQWQPYPLLIENLALAPFIRKGDLVSFPYEFTDYNDIIGEKNAAWPLIINFLKNQKIKILFLKNLRQDSETINFFKKVAYPTTTAPFIKLPDNFQDYFQNIKLAKRQKYKKFLREHSNILTFSSQNIEKDLDIFFELMKTDPKKKMTLTNKKILFYKRIARECQKYVWLEILVTDGKIAAMHYLFKQPKLIMSYNQAFDRINFSNAGTFLIFEIIKKSIQQGAKKFDFLLGKENYKYEFGAKDLQLYEVKITL